MILKFPVLVLKFIKTYRSILKYRYMIPSLQEGRVIWDDNEHGLIHRKKIPYFVKIWPGR